MATEISGELITLESDLRAAPIGSTAAEGPFLAGLDQDFVTLTEVETLLENYLSNAGGVFTLLDTVDFGLNFGLQAIQFIEHGADVAEAQGTIALTPGGSIQWHEDGTPQYYSLHMFETLLYFNDDLVAMIPEVNTLISNAISALSTVYQPLDADLTDIAALTGPGFLVHTTGNVWDLATVTANRALASDADGLPTASVTTATELSYLSGVIAPLQTQFAGVASTGIRYGGAISINADPTKFDVAEVSAVFISHPTPSSTPVLTYVTAGPFTAQTVTNIGTQVATYLALASNGTIQQFSSPLTPTQRREYAELGAVIHSNLTTINAVNPIVAATGHGVNQVHDLMDSIGPLNLTGNKYTPNGANLNVNVSAGRVFKFGANFHTDEHDPHRVLLSSGTAITFRYRLQNSTEYADRTTVDPNFYDNAGVLTAVPTNKFTIQRWTRFSSGLTRVQYGQNIYNSLDEAVTSIATEPFVAETNIAENGILRAYLVVREGTTDLTSATHAQFLESPKFGGAAVNAGAALTSANIIAALGYTPAVAFSRTLWGQTFDGSANVSGALTSVGNITGTAGIALTATAGTLALAATGANIITLSTNGSERGRVSSAGNLLWGTTTDNATHKLQVNGSGYFSDRISVGTSDATLRLNISNGTLTGWMDFNATGLAVGSPGTLALYSNSTERMRLSSAGNLLIGTTTDNGVDKLQVNGSAKFTAITPLTLFRSVNTASSGVVQSFNLLNASSAEVQYAYITGLIDSNTAGSHSGRVSLGIAQSGSLSEKILITTTGVGLGVNPSTAFCVLNNTDSQFRLTTFAVVGDSGQGVALDAVNAAAGALTPLVIRADSIRFRPSGTEAGRFSTGGNLLIGTTTDDGSNKLQVNGNGIRIATAQTPASASAAGTTGTVAWDTNYIYICTATNTWKRAAIATW